MLIQFNHNTPLMIYLPPEMIYKIASFLTSHRDIYAIAEVFPNLRFKLRRAVDYEIYQRSLKGKFIVKKILYTGNTMIKFPDHLKLLQFHRHFNQPISIPLPPNLEIIYFGSQFNQPIDGLLPNNLKKIVCFGNFNQTVDNLPPKLQELNLGEMFNHPLDHLPTTLNTIWIKDAFSHSLDNLPNSIETIHLMCHYSQKINKLPSNIKKFRTYTTFPKEYTGERELDYLKELYPALNLKYYFRRGYGAFEELF